jgi:hypothetical protein
VLFDHRLLFSGVRETIADPVTGALLEARLPDGRARMLLTRAGRDGLVERLLIPLVRRYGLGGDRPDLAPQVLAFEFMNEPDFVVEEWERDLSSHVTRPIPFEVLAELVQRFSDIVHAHSMAMTTIGTARLHNLWAWEDEALGLDVLQVHSYPDLRHPEREQDLFGWAVASLGVRQPVILGEFPANATAHHPEGASPPPQSLDDYLEFAVTSGYVGAWPWSFSGTDAYGSLPEEPLGRFAARYPELVNPRARQATER